MSRYSYADAVRRIQRKVEESGRPLKAIHDDLGIPKDKWSKCIRVNDEGTGGIKSSFSIEEFGRIADYFKAPQGWPFIDEDVGLALDRALDALRQRPSPRSASPAVPTSGRHRAAGGNS